jgi:hypothetical protein
MLRVFWRSACRSQKGRGQVAARRCPRGALLALSFALATAAAGAQETGAFDGVWLSVGYGYALRFRGDSLEALELTEISCVP